MVASAPKSPPTKTDKALAAEQPIAAASSPKVQTNAPPAKNNIFDFDFNDAPAQSPSSNAFPEFKKQTAPADLAISNPEVQKSPVRDRDPDAQQSPKPEVDQIAKKQAMAKKKSTLFDDESDAREPPTPKPMATQPEKQVAKPPQVVLPAAVSPRVQNQENDQPVVSFDQIAPNRTKLQNLDLRRSRVNDSLLNLSRVRLSNINESHLSDVRLSFKESKIFHSDRHI